ncbi:MAG: DUF5721 family protein [Eubacteriales bacterium]|nr:DUF5721 family protein [Eubacteriales bacterium]
MIALRITDVKGFMAKLLGGSSFDAFYFVEASITTFNTFMLDGSLHPDFFDEEKAKNIRESGQIYSLWGDVRNLCFSIIKGTRSPLSFKIVLQQSRKNTEKILLQSGTCMDSKDIHGLYLNFQYNNGELMCTTGTSLRIFTMDKTLDNYWDSLILRFFDRQEFSFEQL